MRRTIGVLAAASGAWTLVTSLGGGFTITVAGHSLSSHNPSKPEAVFVLFLVTWIALQGHARLRAAAQSAADLAARGVSGAVTIARMLDAIRPSASVAAAMLALSVFVVGCVFNTWTASGSDGFAYVSQAALWRHGQLEIPVPLARRAPWPDAVQTFTPFGYRPAFGGAPAIVPITAQGLPLLMAGMQAIAGHCAAFLISPIAGGVLVWLTFAIGCRVRAPGAGLIAAWLTATSPTLLFMVMWPMTDVPAGAWAALMIWLLLGRSRQAGLLAGLAAGAGVLTRSNFVIIAAAGGAWLLIEAWQTRDREDYRRVMAFALATAPGILLFAALNVRWYGSPLASGYGSADDLFSLSRLTTNVTRYATWLAQTSPLAWLGVVALAWPTRRLWTGVRGGRAPLLLMLVAVAAAGVYAVYISFNDWWFLRFLLPAWPALFAGAGVLLHALMQRNRWLSACLSLLLVIAGVNGIRFARARGVFNFDEQRYVHVARLVDAATESSAIILTWQHSGTLRYYAGRDTLRFDLLDPDWLDRSVDWLRARGRHPYVLVEDWELPIFQARFRDHSALGALAFPPVFEWESSRGDGKVWLFDPDRQHLTTARLGTEIERETPRCAEPIGFPGLKP